ncbi:MAG: methylthioribulose 1-phosphate dehydratase [Synechococcales cyanobacterium RU_4_20]|nr:methylthioribulose 1-phosphate dehydratase [Synechococcales cyanobacterium RU_4_20]NJR69526.1 methylthioribulose 1-phosphate dehydratase [Synechococcales cyanobacterium CRU_2_2]
MAIYIPQEFQRAAEVLSAVGRELHRQGWSTATSSNYSLRLNSECCAITTSGQDKGKLVPQDIMVVDLDGQALTPQTPSAETLLHTRLYQQKAQIGAVLHTHSKPATLMGLMLKDQSVLHLAGYELLKAFAGIRTHESVVTVPIFENTQDIDKLAIRVSQYLDEHSQTYGYLIRGHGLYTWGKDMQEARRHLEAFEFLLSCELEMLKLRY